MIAPQHYRRINRPISLGLSIGRLINSLLPRTCPRCFTSFPVELPDLFFVVADAGGDGLDGGAQGCDVVG
jgi:hypothetical protein